MIQYRTISKYVKIIANPLSPHYEYQVFIIKYDDSRPELYTLSYISSFIYIGYGNNKYSTKLQAAKNICTFLNFMIHEHENNLCHTKRDDGLYSLTIQNFADFINYLTYIKQDAYNTVKQYERNITRFYAFLESKGVLPLHLITAESNSSKEEHKLQYISPFSNTNNKYLVHFPYKNAPKKEILKDLDEDTFILFIEFAELYFPNIALAVELECCGGLRGAEIVNLQVDDVQVFSRNRYIKINVKDHQYMLFGRRSIKLQNSQVKKPRSGQVVFDFNNRLFEIWEKHLKFLDTYSKDNNNPLFINSNGLAMSGDSYRQQFNKLKFHFISFLENNSNYKLVDSLKSKKWSTHIGRHIYTNYLLKKGVLNDSFGRPNAEYLAVLRGDKSVMSANIYIDESVLLEQISQKLELLSQMALIN